MKKTASALGISEQKVRKMLIDAGAYETEESRRISELYKKGMSEAEISQKLGISESKVNGYLPYSKCIYNAENPTVNAQRIRQCRERKRHDSL